MNEHDSLQRFLFVDTKIRGEIVRLNTTYQNVLERHPYPLSVQKLLGETLAATALLSAILKFEGSLTLQIQSDGPVQLLVAQSDHEYHLRGLAQWQKDVEKTLLAQQALNKGQLILTIKPKNGEQYQGIVALSGTTLAHSLEGYFHQSEQLPTFLYLCADEHAAAGMLIQLMPDDRTEENYSFWEHVIHLAHTITAPELLNLNNTDILKRLFHEETIELFNPSPVTFRCSCSIERMERALLLMSAEESQELLNTYKKIDVTCEFCNYHYSFDAAHVARLRAV